ncbi:hypothetical protein [Paraburkholderia phosphatilytica]|uniref:hypothetical protein n=1 Tax=Paraburkholderia phosphatilytica TaxID=2282883 RepID=UPI000F5DE81B|nr:hypothetical protein [Paraburkholderia phosphatilytica]
MPKITSSQSSAAHADAMPPVGNTPPPAARPTLRRTRSEPSLLPLERRASPAGEATNAETRANAAPPRSAAAKLSRLSSLNRSSREEAPPLARAQHPVPSASEATTKAEPHGAGDAKTESQPSGAGDAQPTADSHDAQEAAPEKGSAHGPHHGVGYALHEGAEHIEHAADHAAHLAYHQAQIAAAKAHLDRQQNFSDSLKRLTQVQSDAMSKLVGN